MDKKYILSIDQGTTSCRALLVNENGKVVGIAQKEFNQIYPQAGWVEHDPIEILQVQTEVIRKVLRNHQVTAAQLAGIGITNQRETTVVWEKQSGEPIHNAIVWQDKRTSEVCEKMKAEGWEQKVREKTGLVIDSYFSATKIHWILENVPGAKEKAANGELLFGTIDSWLIWNFTNRKSHVTDQTNASRSMLFDLQKLNWDDGLLDYFGIPESMLPEVLPSAAHFGDMELDGVIVPVLGVAGDQQAALFGQTCFEPGTSKNTYGTGCFALLNMGNKFKISENGLITTLACSTSDQPVYALEGSIFMAGAAIQWLRDGLRLIKDSVDSEYFAQKVDTDEVYVVPAFAGLGAPYWDMYARGAIFGLTRGSGSEHIIRATLQSLAYQTKDVLDAMIEDAGLQLSALKVDGGAASNNFLMQFQADMLNVKVERPASVETTALGVAYLAGIKAGIWDEARILSLREIEREFEPQMEASKRTSLYSGWQKAVKRSMGWLE